MEFRSKEELEYFIYGLRRLGDGAQGVCGYSKKTGNVYKIFADFFDPDLDSEVNYSINEILRFKDIESELAIFPKDTISVCGKVYGEVQNYADARNLYKTNPFKVNLDNLEKAVVKAYDGITLLSKKGISTYDLSYNTLYRDDCSKIYLIDTFEWNYSGKSTAELIRENIDNFSYEICLFLVDSIFNGFVDSKVQLKELYADKTDAKEFIKIFRRSLDEDVGKRVDTLADAKKLVDKRPKEKIYKRQLGFTNKFYN